MILICTVLFYFSFLNHVYSALQLLVLDFLHAFRCFNIQSAPPASRFWTSSLPHCTSQQKVDTTLYFYTSFNEHNTPYTVLESDNSESMPDVLH